MPEQKMSYQERLENEKEEVINSLEFHTLEQTAERNIKAQGKAIREFVQNTYYAPDTIEVKKFTDKYMLEHGYIEPKTNEDVPREKEG